MPNLSGKVAIVTGSTKGIGLAVANQFIEAGASVVVNGRTQTDVDAVVETLGAKAFGVAADVGDAQSCAELVELTVEKFGRLDILVNNAGFGIFKPVSEMSAEEWQRQIDVNLGGVFYLSKAALPHLSESGDGFIINIGSLAGKNFFAGGTGYNASKAGLMGLTEAMMLDVRHDDVRVSVIMPGSVNTNFRGKSATPDRSWPLEADDCALTVMHLLDQPKGAHVSKVEMRPSQPPRK